MVASCQEKAFQQILAYAYLENSDKTKYGSLLMRLQNQQSIKNIQYLSNIYYTEATNILNSQ